MKQYILIASLVAAAVATGLGVWAVLDQYAVDSFLSSSRLYQLAGISGLFSIASFFVGMVYPLTTVTVINRDKTVIQKAV